MASIQSNHSPSHPLHTGAAYIRVSTNDQMELSPESQLKEILQYAKNNQISIPDSYIFMEKEGRSGKKAGNRPEFQRMIATAKTYPRPFEVILVWKFSRFARNQDESTFYKGMLRKKLGINILSVSEPVLDGMYGRLIEMIIEWQDEFYSYNLSTEVRRGMAEKARKGGYQAAIPYGYQYNGPDTVPTVLKEEAEAVQMMFKLFVSEGWDITSIARHLNELGRRTKRGNLFERKSVSYILQNPFYTGTIRWNQSPHSRGQKKETGELILSKGKHTAIIPEALFQAAQEKLGQRPHSEKAWKIRNSPSCSHYLSGLLKCPVCGANLTFSSSQTPNFQCWRYAKGLHKGSASISEKKAVSALLKSLEAIISHLPAKLSPFVSNSNNLCSFLLCPDISPSAKQAALCSIIDKIIYDRPSHTFRFYYHI